MANQSYAPEQGAKNGANTQTLAAVQAYVIGAWQSIGVELRPTEDRTGTGQITPTYLKRHFTYRQLSRTNASRSAGMKRRSHEIARPSGLAA